MLEIICTNNNIRKKLPSGMTLKQIAAELNVVLPHPILGAKVNNKVRNLNYEIFSNKVITFIDATDPSGYAMYDRSLNFLLYKAVKDLYPTEDIIIKHAISGGKYCEFENPDFKVTKEVVANLLKYMKELVAADLPIVREELPTEEAIALYKKEGLFDKEKLLKNRHLFYTSVYAIENTINYFFGCLVPSTSYLKYFDLAPYEDGFLLRTPSRQWPDKISPMKKSPKYFNIFKEHKEWIRLVEAPYVGDLNNLVRAGQTTAVVLVSEALQEKKVISIVDAIKKREGVKMVLLSGPSSSGKTTTCRRLSVQLGVLGFRPVQISVDNYFVDREFTPKDEKGNYDFEHIKAIDLDLLHENLSDLINGKEIDVPTFNFQQGKKTWLGNKLKLDEKSIIIMEGIHCLNPLLTEGLDAGLAFKVFVSALPSIAMDKHNPIHSNDNRLIRRIIRDFNYRGYSAEETIRRWTSVRNGEEKWIFPFQENADMMFNSALVCELGLLKKYAFPILYRVPENIPEYTEAIKLKKLLDYFEVIDDSVVPHYSILREFFGGSVFTY